MSPLSPPDCDSEESSQPLDAFRKANILTVPVPPARLAWGTYDHDRNRDVGEGDIHASYSADTIAMSGRIRKAFRWQAQLMVTVSLAGCGGIEQAEAYRLLSLRAFIGTPTTYADKIETGENAEAARNDPNGFYHGITVRHSSESFVLFGPPVLFVAEPVRPNARTPEPAQLNLF
jgi:hypothetical protein